jgi:hypothetical protein
MSDTFASMLSDLLDRHGTITIKREKSKGDVVDRYRAGRDPNVLCLVERTTEEDAQMVRGNALALSLWRSIRTLHEEPRGER